MRRSANSPRAGAASRGSSRRLWLLALLGVTLAVRLAVALADYRSLIGLDIYQDDAFYYLKLAQNVVHGRGLTFDGVTPTNGFHPLYLFLLLPILALSGADPIAPIQASALLLARQPALPRDRARAGGRDGLCALRRRAGQRAALQRRGQGVGRVIS